MSRGGYLHSEVLLRPIEQLLRSAGATVRSECAVRKGRDTGYVDLYASWTNRSVVIEVELTPVRVRNDVAKAGELSPDLLVIVTPTASVARAVRRRLGMRGPSCRRRQLEIWVYPFGAAIERLAAWCRLDSHDTESEPSAMRKGL